MRRGGEEQRFTDGGTQPAMKSAEEALQMVVRVAQRRLPRVTVPLSDADLGKILAEDIYSPDPLPPSKVQACLQHPIKTDAVQPEFHCAIIRWNVNDGSCHPGCC